MLNFTLPGDGGRRPNPERLELPWLASRFIDTRGK